jgi:hypothetical protein
MQTHELHPAQPRFDEPSDEPISLAHLLAALRRYRPAITVVLAVLLIGYALLAIALYLFGPATVVTTLPFRIVFEGADAGRYPNGLAFSTTEITATPVLQRVYNDNRLQRFINFADLKSSIFIIEQNKELDRLALEYNAKLGDARLSPVDRERIEREYDLRKESIRRTDYALNFVDDDRTASVPRALRIQILKSVLDAWAEAAMNDKGAGRYRIPVLSRNILEPENALEGQDYIIATDILRTKANRIISSIDQMLTEPGAEVLAAGKEKITLPDIRVNLEDMRRFRLEPLMATIRTHRLSRNYPAALEFLQSQLDSARRHRDEEHARVDRLQQSLDMYMQRNGANRVVDAQGTRTGPAAGGNQVTPQVDKSFLDQLIDLVAQKRDVEYRQRQVDLLNRAAIGQLLPAETEVAYYESLVQAMKSGGGGAPAAPDTEKTIKSEYARAAQETYKAVDQVSEIYRIMSRNLNPGLVVYTLNGPVARTSARSYSIVRLFAYGALLMIVALPLVMFGALLHNRIREEEQVEESQQRLAEAES